MNYIHILIYAEPVTIFSHTICRFLKKDHIWEWSSSSPFDHVEDWLHVVTLYDVEPFQNPESNWTSGCLPAWCIESTLTFLWAVLSGFDFCADYKLLDWHFVHQKYAVPRKDLKLGVPSARTSSLTLKTHFCYRVGLLLPTPLTQNNHASNIKLGQPVRERLWQNFSHVPSHKKMELISGVKRTSALSWIGLNLYFWCAVGLVHSQPSLVYSLCSRLIFLYNCILIILSGNILLIEVFHRPLLIKALISDGEHKFHFLWKCLKNIFLSER